MNRRRGPDGGGVSLALLDASVGETPAQQNFRRVLDADVETFKTSEGELPPTPGAEGTFPFDGAVVTGSQSSVYDDDPWIDETLGWLRRVIGVGLPVLGVCWGHQAVAQAVGGAVAPMDEYELGYETVRRRGDDTLFSGLDDRFVAFETHSDAVTEVPPEATVLAETDRALQAFRVANAWGVQFHPEFDLETAREVTGNKRGALGDEAVEEILAGLTPDRHAATAEATRVFDNFLGVVGGADPRPQGSD
jgi:GMP synthase (glutamine-hydrolysing)